MGKQHREGVPGVQRKGEKGGRKKKSGEKKGGVIKKKKEKRGEKEIGGEK